MDFLQLISKENILYALFIVGIFVSKVIAENTEDDVGELFSIEGKVEVVSTSNKDWISNTQVSVDGGLFVAHLR